MQTNKSNQVNSNQAEELLDPSIFDTDLFETDYENDFWGNDFGKEYSIEDFKDECDLFNDIAEKSNLYSLVDLEAQYDLIKEEVDEIWDGLVNKDLEEILDGCIDTLVVTLGLLQKLENAGVDVKQAMKLTSENNLSKFTSSEGIAYASVKEYAKKGIAVEANYNGYLKVYVLKDANGKVRKPIGFVSNDLKDCIPNSAKERVGI